MTGGGVRIRSFRETDARQVRDLFIQVNRQIAPPAMKAAFEGYIQRSLAEEMDRIADYYQGRQGGFWVAMTEMRLAGMFGLEPSPKGMELRRMYVAPDARRQGVARAMLNRAEQESRRFGAAQLDLSTSELQPAALALYRGAGYALVREEIAETASNKTLGGGLRRYHFAKPL